MAEIPLPNASLAERWRRSQDEVSRLRDRNTTDQTTPEEAVAPARCPVCRSTEVTTTSKVASVDAYWRCGGCGEVWNVARHRAGARYARDLPPFRR